MDVICPGYVGPVMIELARERFHPEFIPHAFEDARRTFLEETALVYGSSTELFLLNVTVEDGHVGYETDSVLTLCFEKALADKAIEPVDRFMTTSRARPRILAERREPCQNFVWFVAQDVLRSVVTPASLHSGERLTAAERAA
jgi:hypothetical protein